ncbi:MAG: hypothetical protein V4591_10865 [Bdellovibrionota bacterium]
MKSKLKNGISFAELVDVKDAFRTILSIQSFTISLYENENVETWVAHDETNKLIFSKSFYALGGLTIAQWVSRGGNEKKALGLIKDLIADAVKASNIQEEQNAMIERTLKR